MAVQNGIKLYMRGEYSSHVDANNDDDTLNEDIGRAFRQAFYISLDDGAVANADVAATAALARSEAWARTTKRILGAVWMGGSAVTTHNTNYGIIRLMVANSDGAIDRVVGHINTNPDTQGNIAVNAPYAFTLVSNTTKLELSAGQVLLGNITKAAAGAVFGAGRIVGEWEDL